MQQQTTQLFFKIPKQLIYSDVLTLEEAFLYAYLLDKRALSEYTNTEVNPGKYKDEKGIFCNASIDELQKIMKCGKNKVINMKKKLQEIGLIEEKRQITGSNKIYVYDIPANVEIFNKSDFQTYVNP